MSELTPNSPEQLPQERQDILVPSGSVNVALRVAMEHGYINTENLVGNSEVELNDDQANALIEELQSGGYVSREASEDGSFVRVEIPRRTAKIQEIAPKVGSASITRGRFSRMLSTPFRQVEEFVKHNDAVVISKAAGRGIKSLSQTEAKTTVQNEKQRVADTQEKNRIQAEATRLAREKRAAEEEWQKGRRWRLVYPEKAADTSSDQQSEANTPSATNLELIENIDNGGSLFGGEKKETKAQADRNKHRKQRHYSPRDIAELVKLKVMSPEEGRLLLLGEDAANMQATTQSKPQTASSVPKPTVDRLSDQAEIDEGSETDNESGSNQKDSGSAGPRRPSPADMPKKKPGEVDKLSELVGMVETQDKQPADPKVTVESREEWRARRAQERAAQKETVENDPAKARQDLNRRMSPPNYHS